MSKNVLVHLLFTEITTYIKICTLSAVWYMTVMPNNDHYGLITTSDPSATGHFIFYDLTLSLILTLT